MPVVFAAALPGIFSPASELANALMQSSWNNYGSAPDQDDALHGVASIACMNQLVLQEDASGYEPSEFADDDRPSQRQRQHL